MILGLSYKKKRNRQLESGLELGLLFLIEKVFQFSITETIAYNNFKYINSILT